MLAKVYVGFNDIHLLRYTPLYIVIDKSHDTDDS